MTRKELTEMNFTSREQAIAAIFTFSAGLGLKFLCATHGTDNTEDRYHTFKFIADDESCNEWGLEFTTAPDIPFSISRTMVCPPPTVWGISIRNMV